jgi:integrase/recombinase XerC
MVKRIPTVEDVIPRSLAGLAPRSRELYAFYLNLLAERHGRRKIDQLVASDITELADWAQAMAVRRSTSAGGVSAREHSIAACRRLFDTAIADGYMTHNPAKAVRKPQRAESSRTALTDDQVGDLFRVVSDDETALLTFLLETACRREGLLDLTTERLHPARQTVMLHEKGDRTREQPVSRLMMEYLRQADCPVYRWTRRRLDSLWLRIRRDLAWADEINLSTHWFRHTTITNVERATRSPVLAAAFAGHRLSRFGTTATYIAPYGLPDIAWAFIQVFGGRHPLIPPDYIPFTREGPI